MPQRRPTLLPALLVAALLALAVLLPGAALGASGHGTINGSVPMRGLGVQLWEVAPSGVPIPIGYARSGRSGTFTLHYSRARSDTVDYLVAERPWGPVPRGELPPPAEYRIGAVLPEGLPPRRVIVNERTTVALGFTMAQFFPPQLGSVQIFGKGPGLRNAAAMSGDLVGLDGGLSEVLRTFPNGRSDSTLATFNTLADLLALCRNPGAGCTRLLQLAHVPGQQFEARDTLEATEIIARNPWHDAAGIGRLAKIAPKLWTPTLTQDETLAAWTLALRFEGDPPGLDGPGNFAIDANGNLWVANNYAYSRQSRKPACYSDKVFRFTPTGQTYPGSPYVGGGLSGVGFGVTIDPTNRVWLGNFGFEGVGCETPADHFTASAFGPSGRAISPPEGWNVGGISWPQGTISDQRGNIWLANCNNDSVTEITPPRLLSPTGAPPSALNFGSAQITAGSSLTFERPFADAVNAKGEVFVTGNGSSTVARLSPSGRPLSLVTGGGLHLPMGIAGDSNGYMWVSNSKWVVAPCPGTAPKKQATEQAGKGGGNVTLLQPDGEVAPGSPITGGGLDNPWGIAVDADDHVWVANFGGRRLSELCGTDTAACPPGKRRVGAAISPKSGYGFDGLVKNTGVAIDPSGNVWLTNNWKNVPIQTNPGGYQIVAYLGLAAPTAAPQIGPPQRP